MKNRILTTMTALGLLLTLAAASVQAQSGNKMEVNIPFAFMVGERQFPAGAYSIKQVARNDLKMLLIQSEDARLSALIQTHDVQAGAEPSKGRAVFHQYGDKYFLSRVWTPGTSVGRELYRSSAERRLAKEIETAQSRANLRNVEVLALMK